MSDPQPFIRFEVPDGGKEGVVHAILHAHVQYEAIHNLRLSWVHVLAVLGGLMALTVAFPSAAPAWLTANLPLAWALCCVGTVVTAIRERLWSLHRSRLLAEAQPDGDTDS